MHRVRILVSPPPPQKKELPSSPENMTGQIIIINRHEKCQKFPNPQFHNPHPWGGYISQIHTPGG